MHTIIRLFLSAWILSSNWIVSFGILFHSGENNFSGKKISLRDGKERKRERKVLFPIIIEMLTPLSWKIQIANLFPEIRQFPLNDLFSPSPSLLIETLFSHASRANDNSLEHLGKITPRDPLETEYIGRDKRVYWRTGRIESMAAVATQGNVMHGRSGSVFTSLETSLIGPKGTVEARINKTAIPFACLVRSIFIQQRVMYP